jgi:hypothetical protein
MVRIGSGKEKRNAQSSTNFRRFFSGISSSLIVLCRMLARFFR